MSGRATTMELNFMQRVKVYRLNDEGKWDDKGTGHVSVEYLERSDALGLVVIDEEDSATLLIHRISADDIYRRQEETIISWTDPEVATDLALSFQETMGCSFIWDQICNVQRSVHFPSVGPLDNGPRSVNDELEHSGTSQDDDDAFHDSGTSDAPELPPVDLASLPQIVKTVVEVDRDRSRITALILRDQNYIRKLMELFRTCEDLENSESLHLIYKIVKGLISLNDRQIFDIIFGDEFIMDIVGALEYDPELPMRQDHRGFLKEQVVFKEAVPIRDPQILSKIHQTYRIGYIKDVILPRVLDDPTFTTINSMMLSNNVGVVSALHGDKTFISELFSRLRMPNLTERSLKELVFFVHEFCSLCKTLYIHELLSSLVSEGLFEIISKTLQSSDSSLRVRGSDILIIVLNHDPGLLRSFLGQQQDHALFGLLVKGMLTPSEGGLQAQMLEIMRMLLDSDTMDTQQPAEKNSFLDVFYTKYMDEMVEVLTCGCPSKSASELSKQPLPSAGTKDSSVYVSAEIMFIICELMRFCVLHHGYRIKYYLMRKHVVEKVLRLVRRKEKYLVVAAVRFLRTCVGLKEEFYNRYLIKNNLFDPVIQAFLDNGNRYNLLNSAVLELIDFIRKHDIKNLIAHLVENYAEKLSGVYYVDTIQQLKLKYEQSLEASAHREGTSSAGNRSDSNAFADTRKRKDDRALDKDEEDYFKEDSDDEEDTASARVTISAGPQPEAIIVNGSALADVPFRGRAYGLVDYDDEDEDVPTLLDSNGVDHSFSRKVDSIIPISDPVWPAMDEVSFPKRKPIGCAESSEDVALLKRQKQEASKIHSDWGNNRISDNTQSKPELVKDPRVHEDRRRSTQAVYSEKENKALKGPDKRLTDEGHSRMGRDMSDSESELGDSTERGKVTDQKQLGRSLERPNSMPKSNNGHDSLKLNDGKFGTQNSDKILEGNQAKNGPCVLR